MFVCARCLRFNGQQAARTPARQRQFAAMPRRDIPALRYHAIAAAPIRDEAAADPASFSRQEPRSKHRRADSQPRTGYGRLEKQRTYSGSREYLRSPAPARTRESDQRYRPVPRQHGDEPHGPKLLGGQRRDAFKESPDGDTAVGVAPLGDEQSTAPGTELRKRVVRRLKYVGDPYNLAQDVAATLGAGRYQEALLLTQLASRSVNCAVAWNHLIDWSMKQGKVRNALKLFNDMKKRAQIPNAQAYTIVFSGCANSSRPQNFVGDAIKIYQNLLRSERPDANVMHMNAVMDLCAKAGDLESMYTVFSSSNETTRAPDRYTYTILLNGLRATTSPDESPVGSADPSDPEYAPEPREPTPMMKARVLWDEVLSKWRQGRLVLSESLVCAMGQMLLTDTISAAREVPALLETTMGIPRPNAERRPEAAGHPIERLVKVRPGELEAGHKTLSLALQAVTRSRDTSSVMWYWNFFTKTSGLRPDRQNWIDLMRALVQGRASARAAEMLALMPEEVMSAQACRAAMKACQRDSLNKSSRESAARVLDTMLSRLSTPDIETLDLYVILLLASSQQVRALEAKGRSAQARQMWGEQVATGLGRLQETLLGFKKILLPGTLQADSSEGGGPDAQALAQQQKVVTLLRRVVGAIDLVLKQQVVEGRMLEQLKDRRDTFNRVIVNFLNKVELQSPGARQEIVGATRRRDLHRW